MKKLTLKRIEKTPAESGPYGVLTEWNDERGYGFITPYGGGEKVFLHIKSVRSSARRPKVGEQFYYKLTTDERGRPRAEDAYQPVLDEKRSTPFHHSILKGLSYFWPLAIIPAFVMIAITGNFTVGLCVAFVINSLLTILFYWEDKYLAQYKYWRIPEKCLHIWELLCGWPGALFAQQAFKHKRSKISFIFAFWICVIINVMVLSWLYYHGEALKIGNTLGSLWHEIKIMYE